MDGSATRLFGTFAVASLLPVLALGASLHVIVQREVGARALDEASAQARAIADGRIEPALDGHDLRLDLDSSERDRLITATRSLRGDAAVLRLRLRSPDGDIVFNAFDPTSGRIIDRDDEVSEAAEGEPVRVLTRLDADTVDGSGTSGEQAVEIYVALHESADLADGATSQPSTIGVLELYLPYAPFARTAAATQRRLDTALAVGLGALWCVLAMVTWSVTRRLRQFASRNLWLATHDQLTGLPNRLWFNDEVRRRHRNGDEIELAVIDVARLREINDTLGQVNGDAYLCEVADGLRRSLGDDRVLARLTGGEFGVVASCSNSPSIDECVARFSDVDVDLDGVSVSPEFHVGLAKSDAALMSPESVVRAAELAAHAARAAGVPSLAYRRELDQFDPGRLALVAELRRAIVADELVLHYQPKIDLRTGALHSAEALVRWRHRERGLIAPTVFIPIAESTTLIGPLTDWVVRRAASDVSLAGTLPADLAVAVNVSAANLRERGFETRLLSIMEQFDVAPERFEVEITETAVVTDTVEATRVLRVLHDAGIRISLDDFGQGATSLVSLSRLPLDEIKIDREFIEDLDTNHERRTIVASVIELGHRLGLTVVAEGIETSAVAHLLTEMGCDVGQGYLWSRPLPPEEIGHWNSVPLLEQYLSGGQRDARR